MFGRWFTDRFGLPAYRYRIDEARDPRARRPELEDVADPTDAWSQLGNDHVVANAYNHGYTQLWSQDRVYEWVNRYSAADGQYAGGFGYLRTGGRTISTLYADRPPRRTRRARVRRGLLAAHARRGRAGRGRARVRPVRRRPGAAPRRDHSQHDGPGAVRELVRVLGREPVGAIRAGGPRGLDAPSWDARRRILSVGTGRRGPRPPAAPDLRRRAARVRWRATPPTPPASSARAAGRAPAAVAADRLDGRPAAAVAPGSVGRTLFALRAPLRLAPGAAVTLRYAYGAAQPRAIRALVARWRSARRPLASSQRRWARWLPQASLGAAARLARARAPVGRVHGALGHHLRGVRGQPRDLAGRLLPVRRVRRPDRVPRPAPAHAPDDLRRARRWPATCSCTRPASSPPAAARSPTARSRSAARAELPPSNDMDLWLLWSAAEYGLATRDLAVFDRQGAVPRRGRGVALAPPEAGLCAPGVAARPARRVPHHLHRRLVGLLRRVPEHGRVHARVGPAGLRVPAPGRAGGRARRPRLRDAPAPARGGAPRRCSAASGPGAGTPAATEASAGSAPARSSASRSRGTSSPGSQTGARLARSWPASGAS